MRPGAAADGLVNLSEIAEIELFVLKRMKEFAIGDHASVFRGDGFNFVGIREWSSGDRMCAVDWAQSTLTNFSPLAVREFEQDSTATILAVADASLSTRCGPAGRPIAMAIARALAALGLSAVFFQDAFGLLTFGENFRPITAAPPRIGKPHVLHCIDLYQGGSEATPSKSPSDIGTTIAAYLRKTSLVPVISDFLFAEAPRMIADLGRLNASHDVFLVMADVRFAYQLPTVSAGWVDTCDIETGQTRVVSRRELSQLSDRIAQWQEELLATARDCDLDVVRVGIDRWEMETALVEFAAERRLRKT